MTDQQINSAQTAENIDNELTIDLKDVMIHLLAKWKMILSIALLLATVAGIYTVAFVTPMYRATSTIYVLSRKDSAINMSDLQLGSALTNDYIKVFDMWEVHEQVITNLNLPYNYAQMRNMIKVENVPSTRMLDISVTNPSSKEAAIIANEYANVVCDYIADTMATDKPNIMSVALEPSKPVSPNVTKNVVLGFILGFILSAGLVIIRTVMDDRYKTAEDIRKYTGLNTLAVVPIEINMSSKAGKNSRRYK